MQAINISIPAIDPEQITALVDQSNIASSTEVEAIAALRAAYAPLAKHNGFIRIGHTWRGDQGNWSESADYHFRRDDVKIRGLLALDDFGSRNTSQWAGDYCGSQLWLLESGEWLRIKRSGYWSQYQGSPEGWACGGDVIPDGEDEYAFEGSIEVVGDAKVIALYKLEAVVKELGDSLKTLAEKLPERFNRLKQRTQLASAVLAAVKGA